MISSKKTFSTYMFLLLAILLASILVRSFFLEAPFTHDEWYTYDVVGRNFVDMHVQMYDDVHVPLYFYAVKLFTTVFGFSAISLRVFSVLIGVLGIAAFALFTRKWFGKKISLIATAILSVSVFHVAYSQTARMYSLLFLCIVISAHFLFELLFEHKKRSIIGYVIANLALIYTHFFSVFFVLFELATLFFLRKKLQNTRRIVCGHIMMIILAVPFVLFMGLQIVRKFNGTSYANWMPSTPLGDIYLAFSALSSSYILTPVFLLIIVYFLFNIKKVGLNASLLYKKILSWQIYICFILPLFITFITPLFAWRYFFIAYPTFVIILALFLGDVYKKRKEIFYVLFSLILLFLLLASFTYIQKNYDSAEQIKECTYNITQKIEEYESYNTAFVSVRWLNEWVPNHKPIDVANERMSEIFDKDFLLINEYSDIRSLFNEHRYVMAISPSGWITSYINQTGIISVENGSCYGYNYKVYVVD